MKRFRGFNAERRALRHVASLLGLLTTITAAPLPGQNPVSSSLVPIPLPAGLDTVLRQYEDGWVRRDAQALAALFTEDGFILRPNRPLVQGRDNIREAYQNSGGPLVLRAYGYAQSDSVAYVVGGFARTAASQDIGKFVLALRRTASGGWLIAADMDNGNSE